MVSRRRSGKTLVEQVTDSEHHLKPFATHVFKSRAGILDIDVNMHLNNASLILATEFARWNLIGSTDLLGHAFKNRWAFMLGSQAVRYRHEIHAFHSYEVRTSLLAADDSWMWLRHTVHSDNRMCAHVLTRVIIKQGRKTIHPHDVFRLIGVDPNSVGKPEDSEEVQGFLKWDAEAATHMKNNPT